MTDRHLRIYLAVYQTENITRAAEQLHMTQPAVTRVIQEIENDYGIRLFERLNKRLSVTEAGKLFYAHALHIVDVFDRMEKGIRNWDEIGVIRIGASISLGNTLIPQVNAQFRRSHPSLQVYTMISNSVSLQQALMENRIDFALMEGDVQAEMLCREAISRGRLVPILPPDDPRANEEGLLLRDFEHDALVLREQGSAARMYLDHVFALHGLRTEPIMESVSTQAILRAVHAGLGVSFLPERLVRADLDSGFVATASIKDEGFVRTDYLVWHKQKFLTQGMQAMMDAFRIAAAAYSVDSLKVDMDAPVRQEMGECALNMDI